MALQDKSRFTENIIYCDLFIFLVCNYQQSIYRFSNSVELESPGLCSISLKRLRKREKLLSVNGFDCTKLGRGKVRERHWEGWYEQRYSVIVPICRLQYTESCITFVKYKVYNKSSTSTSILHVHCEGVK